MRVILLGAPGVGKGTQGVRLAQRLGAAHIATGSLLRQMQAGPDADAVRVIEAGYFVPDALVDRLVEAAIDAAGGSGFVLDGYPRNLTQAGTLDRYLSGRLDAVVVLEMPESALVERLSGRRVCPQCGAIYRLETAPSTCESCGSALVQRADDRPERIQTRLELYREQTAPLIEFYCGRGLARRVNAQGDVADVFARICKTLGISI